MFYSILEEKCGADINNEAIKCKTLVDNCSKERSLGELYFPTKTKFLQVLQQFRRKWFCPYQTWKN